jgi:ABC-type maltose transport system permease subunit
VLEATTNAWHLYDQLVPLVASVQVANPLLVKAISAASVMVAIPIMALFFYLQRFLESGLTIGSVKG